ncbi:hypothetical protein SJAV_03730 [Sulfurisphaera javensis]|uniref:Uncharacterized protein n=1 Tax=Sulfurisphaera javensis TaxID=2049879 RepID=A0AAT9GNF6_9CREN
MPIIKFKNGRLFSIDENTIAELTKEDIKIDVLVVKKIEDEDLKDAISNGFKLFECKDDEEICLSKVYNIFFAKKKSCKFA